MSVRTVLLRIAAAAHGIRLVLIRRGIVDVDVVVVGVASAVAVKGLGMVVASLISGSHLIGDIRHCWWMSLDMGCPVDGTRGAVDQ